MVGLVVVMVRAGKGTDNFGQGSHSIYITIGPEF